MRSIMHAALPLLFDLMAAGAGAEASDKRVDAFEKRCAGWARCDGDGVIVKLAGEITWDDFDFSEPRA